MNNICVLLDPGHTKQTSGKRSPDGQFREYQYSREILKQIEIELDKLKISHWNSHPEENFPQGIKNDSKDLVIRTNRINQKYKELKSKGITSFLISIHVDAAGNGSEWKNATGWSCWTTKGKTISDILAECMYDAAEEILLPLKKKIRYDRTDGDRDYESNFWILKQSNCACILTENFFQDNESDIEWLLSPEGKKAIVDLHVKGILNYINKMGA